MKRNIAIIAGGDSSEYEVSLRSAAGIESFLADQKQYTTTIVLLRGNDWKAKYLALLEKYTKLQEEHKELLKKMLQ